MPRCARRAISAAALSPDGTSTHDRLQYRSGNAAKATDSRKRCHPHSDPSRAPAEHPLVRLSNHHVSAAQYRVRRGPSRDWAACEVPLRSHALHCPACPTGGKRGRGCREYPAAPARAAAPCCNPPILPAIRARKRRASSSARSTCADRSAPDGWPWRTARWPRDTCLDHGALPRSRHGSPDRSDRAAWRRQNQLLGGSVAILTQFSGRRNRDSRRYGRGSFNFSGRLRAALQSGRRHRRTSGQTDGQYGRRENFPFHRAVYPPSITSSEPVTNFASSDAR